MSLIVEDGTVVAGANSFVDMTFADSYFLNHPHMDIVWSDIDSTKREIYLQWAFFQMGDLFLWKGRIVSPLQTGPWPRVCVHDAEGRPISSSSIPDKVMRAQCEMAVYLATGDQESASAEANLDEVKVDVITVKFRSSSAARAVPQPAARLLTGLGVPRSSIRVGQVVV